LVNAGSAKWISANALFALKVFVAMTQFLDGDAVSHCAIVWQDHYAITRLHTLRMSVEEASGKKLLQ
jgi:hypothetical protein